MKKSAINLYFSSVILFTLFLSACHTPAPDSGFLEHADLMKENKAIPLDAVWFKDGVDFTKYKKIYIADVDSSHLIKMSWWDKATFAETSKSMSPESEVKVLAAYLKEKIIAKFKEEKEPAYVVADTPDSESLIIELALVEVVPTKVWLNSISYIIAGALDTGATAIEGRFRDPVTKEVIFRFKDKRAGPYSLINVGDLTWYSHAKDTIQVWTEILVHVCESKPGEKVSSPFPFTLKPW